MEKIISALKSPKKELIAALDGIRDISVLVVGDLILDRYIWGKVERISPEAPVPVVQVVRVEDRLGGAGNVIRNLRGLGCSVRCAGVLGDDEEGEIVCSLLKDSAIDLSGVFAEKSVSTPLKTRVIAHSQQVVRIDREYTSVHTGEAHSKVVAKLDSLSQGSPVVIVSDYGKGSITPETMDALGKIRSDSRLLVIDPAIQNFGIYKNISFAKPNRKEAEQATGVTIRDARSALKASKILMNRWGCSMMLISLGEDGLFFIDPKHPEGLLLPTLAQDVFDVSGAGDTTTAVFSVALSIGVEPEVAGELANIASGIVVSEVGTVAIDSEKLRDRIEQVAR